MGILRKLFGRSSSEDLSEGAGDGQIPVTQYFFIGNEIQSDPLSEAMIILRQGPREDEDRGDDWEWGVVKCNKRIEVPPDTDAKICVYSEGSIIGATDPFQSQMAWFLSPEEIDALQNEGEIIRSFPFPEDLRDETIPVGTQWSQEDLEWLLLSLNL